jgi:DNA primase
MVRYTKESVQALREKTDIVDIIGRHVTLKRSGASFKGLCPFHEEKTPSFHVHKSSGHYHCFGCAAHGDSISFLMEYERLDFQQAVEFLAERTGVPLVLQEMMTDSQKVEDHLKNQMRACNEEAMHFFHEHLLTDPHASQAREYLIKRRIGEGFVRSFAVGYTPPNGQLMAHLQKKGFTVKEMMEAGLVSKSTGREFFSERILFPILDTRGQVIGFSGRKFLETTYGGKYINTPETLLFKKSRVFFGLSYSKRRMAKDSVAILVEGQIDALQLINEGFQMTVATLGTAFGESHVDILRAIGVEQVYLAFDQDEAGRQSAMKAGQLLLKKGIDVRIVLLSGAKDPDELLQKQGAYAFFECLQGSIGFIDFLVEEAKKASDFSSPAGKQKQVDSIRERIFEWDNPIVIHESIKVLSRLTGIPEEFLKEDRLPIQKAETVSSQKEVKKTEDYLEAELIRHLFFSLEKRPEIETLVRNNFIKEELAIPLYQHLFEAFFSLLDKKQPLLLSNLIELFDTEEIEACQSLLSENKVRPEKAAQALVELLNKIKERNWRQLREKKRREVEAAHPISEEKAISLAKELMLLGSKPPLLTI